MTMPSMDPDALASDMASGEPPPRIVADDRTAHPRAAILEDRVSCGAAVGLATSCPLGPARPLRRTSSATTRTAADRSILERAFVQILDAKNRGASCKQRREEQGKTGPKRSQNCPPIITEEGVTRNESDFLGGILARQSNRRSLRRSARHPR